MAEDPCGMTSPERGGEPSSQAMVEGFTAHSQPRGALPIRGSRSDT